MIGVLLALAVTASPSDCKADLDCFLATLKTCGPAKYADPNLDPTGLGKKMGAVPKGATEYTVSAGTEGKCSVTLQVRVAAFELSPALTAQLGKDADKQRTLGLQRARDNSVQQLCAMTAEELAKGLTLQKKGGYDSTTWAGCKPVGCLGVVAADKGCAWTECKEATRVLSCGATQCAPWHSFGPQLLGLQSLLLRDHTDDKSRCVARCKKTNGDAEVVCK